MEFYTSEKYKKQRKFRRMFWGGLLWTAIIAVVGGSVYGLFFSKFVRTFAVHVSGTDMPLDKDVRGMGPHVLGLQLPANIVFLQAENAGKAILVAHPQLASVIVTKSVRSRIIDVVAAERSREYIWCVQEECYWIDKSGVVFDYAPDTTGQLILKIRDSTRDDMHLGQLAIDPGILAKFVEFIEIVRVKNISVQSIEFNDAISQEAEIILGSGSKLYISARNYSPEFYRRVGDVIATLDLAKTEYIDTRVENRIYYK